MWCINEKKHIAGHTKAFEENVHNSLFLRQSVSIIENEIVISKARSMASGTLSFMSNSYCK